MVDTRGHIACCYAGEIGWSPHFLLQYPHADFKQVEFAGRTWKLVPAVETYCWEGSLNCSINESVSAGLPSTFVQSRSDLLLDEHGPCWLNTQGTVVSQTSETAVMGEGGACWSAGIGSRPF